MVRRFSLPEVSNRELSKNVGVYRFPRVSCAAASADKADLDPGIAELPPGPLFERLARELRRRLGLRLFNLDIIREHGTIDHYYVIDINYFPGYGKMPEYEHVFTDFLLSLVSNKKKPGSGQRGVDEPVLCKVMHQNKHLRDWTEEKHDGAPQLWPMEW